MTELEGSIIKLRSEGKSVLDISKTLSCSKGTVSHYINKHGLGGIKVKRKVKNDGELIADVDKEIITKIIKYREESKTYGEILTLIEISKDKLKRICRIYGVNGHVARNNKVITTELIDKIRESYLELRNYRLVANKYGISKTTVGKYCSDLVTKNTDLEKRKLKVKYVNDFRKKRKLELINYKGGKCQICGYYKSSRALQFHHINPDEKDFTISGKNYSWDKMVKEVDKCILLCGNCHSEVHDEIDSNGFSDLINNIS